MCAAINKIAFDNNFPLGKVVHRCTTGFGPCLKKTLVHQLAGAKSIWGAPGVAIRLLFLQTSGKGSALWWDAYPYRHPPWGRFWVPTRLLLTYQWGEAAHCRHHPGRGWYLGIGCWVPVSADQTNYCTTHLPQNLTLPLSVSLEMTASQTIPPLYSPRVLPR